jgi:hypothetical protein
MLFSLHSVIILYIMHLFIYLFIAFLSLKGRISQVPVARTCNPRYSGVRD